MQRNDIETETSKKIPSRSIVDNAMEQNLRTRLSTFPNDAHTWFILGCLLRKKGKLEDAERSLRRAVTLNPEPIMFWAELALVMNMLGHGVVDPEVLKRLGAEHPESSPSDELRLQLDETRSDDSLRKSEAIPRITSHLTSPCVSCPEYTYYGCRQQDPCEDLLRWRTQSK
ncbi:MAG: tetratricopeptide repeat protein [Candidatus Thorarchaeota archaeon]